MGRFAIVTKKEKWVATWIGNTLKIVALAIIILVFTVTIHSFLAQNNPIPADTLIVEGFISDYALEETIQIFSAGLYETIIITGKQRLKGAYLDQYKNDGEYSAATLIKLGFDSSKIKVVALENDIRKDRTYASAIAVKDWLSDKKIYTVNIVTLGCHARRSRLLFEKALGNKYKIGVIAIQNQQYDPKIWWKSSYGFREVSKEFIAWIYARFFFYP